MSDNWTYSAVRISEPYLGYGYHSDLFIEWLCLDETAERWYLSENKNERWEFDSKAEAEQEILNFGDDFLVAVPVADKPLSPAAIESAVWLTNELVRLNR